MAEQQIELGYRGGTVLRLTVDPETAGRLTAGLGGAEDWLAIRSVQGEHWINVPQLLYVRVGAVRVPTGFRDA